jgi:hypothetical protein
MWKAGSALAVVLLLRVSGVVAAESRHSGTVVGVDRGSGTLIIDELTASNGETPRVVRRTIAVAADARVALQAPTPDGYESLPMSLADVHPGDFVTVIGTGDDGVRASAADVVREASPSARRR